MLKEVVIAVVPHPRFKGDWLVECRELLPNALAIAANFVLYVMIGEINRKLPEDQQIGYLGFHPLKAFKITREYRRLYPRGHLNTVRIIFTLVGGILMIAGAARLSHFCVTANSRRKRRHAVRTDLLAA